MRRVGIQDYLEEHIQQEAINSSCLLYKGNCFSTSLIFIEWLCVCVSILLFMSIYILNAQAGDLESHFTSEMMEPRLLVFHDDQEIVQMLVVAENEALLELSSVSLVEGFVHLIATYYIIFNVSYPNYCKPTLYFLQDVLLARPDANTRRPVRYSSILSRHGLQTFIKLYTSYLVFLFCSTFEDFVKTFFF